MTIVRRTLAAALVVVGALGFVGCTAGADPERDDPVDQDSTSEVTSSGSAPIVFAFVCDDGGVDSGGEDASETYTTYAAVWEADHTDCRAERITGTEMSAQQRAAVRATDGRASLEELAATCAERGVAPWRSSVETTAQADLAAGLLEYCPGHPDHHRLRDALAAHRG
ncbi:hypothetical protein DEJ23_00305 [Curtobacterium sp. MCSS17_008]|uniref:hypothetical protein n=1 Tax=Curtobacterium sp. MCSS17_008 TaxID=2175647 RepID=UPI000DA79301|nr:hypothetical protein [Curtobacterium sp. MCSS17_008]PZF59530.1 hypothetical protein DEJ23_00305 [Curtobacterium sp. MCSS17_008]